MTTLLIANKEMKDIMKIVKSLEELCLLVEGVSETIENKAKQEKDRSLIMLLGTLGTSLLQNLLTELKA